MSSGLLSTAHFIPVKFNCSFCPWRKLHFSTFYDFTQCFFSLKIICPTSTIHYQNPSVNNTSQYVFCFSQGRLILQTKKCHWLHTAIYSSLMRSLLWLWATLWGTVLLVMAQYPGKNFLRWHLHINKCFHSWLGRKDLTWTTTCILWSGSDSSIPSTTHGPPTDMWLYPSNKMQWSQKWVFLCVWEKRNPSIGEHSISIPVVNTFHVSLTDNNGVMCASVPY